ncbi:YidC/Oxa1 family membrane protein insertase [Patescibacteria group bacterium]|nr:YidC/Oxa1 family membrane protein insertase [Patescibacteria group bacterium]
MQNKFTRFLLFFLIFLVVFQLFSGKDKNSTVKNDDIIFTSKPSFTIGKEVVLTMENNSGQTIQIANACPANPLQVEFYQNGEWIKKEATLNDTSACDKTELSGTLESGDKIKIGFGAWNVDLFNEVGQYRIIYQTTLDEKEKNYFHEITIKEAGMIKKGWNTLLYKPIFNTLIFFISKLPGHSLGWGIIFLTLIIKLILLGPNQKALKSQKVMRNVQPQLDALKIKYKDNSQQLAQETMAIWKKHKVSPMGSCLPMLIQFPVLIALFYVVKDGLNVVDPAILYTPLKTFDFSSINPVFLRIIDLTKINMIALPVIIGGLQFAQIRLSLGKNAKSNALSKQSNPAMPMMNKMMQYLMPVMIAVFTAGLPAAVGFYWGVSTLFGIGQQLVVNYAKD